MNLHSSKHTGSSSGNGPACELHTAIPYLADMRAVTWSLDICMSSFSHDWISHTRSNQTITHVHSHWSIMCIEPICNRRHPIDTLVFISSWFLSVVVTQFSINLQIHTKYLLEQGLAFNPSPILNLFSTFVVTRELTSWCSLYSPEFSKVFFHIDNNHKVLGQFLNPNTFSSFISYIWGHKGARA